MGDRLHLQPDAAPAAHSLLEAGPNTLDKGGVLSSQLQLHLFALLMPKIDRGQGARADLHPLIIQPHVDLIVVDPNLLVRVPRLHCEIHISLEVDGRFFYTRIRLYRLCCQIELCDVGFCDGEIGRFGLQEYVENSSCDYQGEEEGG